VGDKIRAVETIAFVLNGVSLRVEAPPAHTTLLDFLRDRGLTGAKEGCAEGECGACTVALVATDAGRTAYRAINSCLMFLPMTAGHEITTVEALALGGQLADAQRAMAAAGGSQCGYCTPGFVMSLFAEQYRPDRTGACDVGALAGNLCRCTGYRPIRDAALSVGPPSDQRFLRRLEQPARTLDTLAIEGFSRPSSVADCVAILERDPDAALVAGGTDLAVESNLRAKRWPHLVSVEGIDELHVFYQDPSRVRVGAALSLFDIGRRWSDAPAVVHEWLTLFASPPIRNRATLGGNLATASPIGDAAPLLMALDARVEIAGHGGRRTVPLSEFFLDYRKTALGRGEMLVAIEVPKPLPAFVRFYKVAKRRADDISTVAAAMALDRDGSGRVGMARFAFGGVAATPIRLAEAEHAIAGTIWDRSAIEHVGAIIQRTLRPMSDHRGSAEYRLQVSQRLVEKFAWESRL
jgi:xanthine dehydrogenase small subunit